MTPSGNGTADSGQSTAAPHAPGSSQGNGALAARLREEVTRRLAEQAGQAAGTAAVTAADRAELGRRVIGEALDAEAARALEEGRPPADTAAEQEAARAGSHATEFRPQGPFVFQHLPACRWPGARTVPEFVAAMRPHQWR